MFCFYFCGVLTPKTKHPSGKCLTWARNFFQLKSYLIFLAFSIESITSIRNYSYTKVRVRLTQTANAVTNADIVFGHYLLLCCNDCAPKHQTDSTDDTSGSHTFQPHTVSIWPGLSSPLRHSFVVVFFLHTGVVMADEALPDEAWFRPLAGLRPPSFTCRVARAVPRPVLGLALSVRHHRSSLWSANALVSYADLGMRQRGINSAKTKAPNEQNRYDMLIHECLVRERIIPYTAKTASSLLCTRSTLWYKKVTPK